MPTNKTLSDGLRALGKNFNADICSVCEGVGQLEQTYTAGCGMGSYRSMGKCDWCNGTGLIQNDAPAPLSVLNQVMQAAKDTTHASQ
jgi:DnaJ-class molecular chaperone